MYSLNTTAARQADQRSERITEIGKYIGVFTRAEDVESTKGTRGIDFAFQTDAKQTANFTLWTLNADGKELFGYKQLQALMTCLRVKQLETTTAVVKKWDRVANQVLEVQAEVFEDLMDRPIGILFETEEYEKNGGGTGVKVVPVAFFDADTELMASEILDKKVQPAQLAKMLPTLKHRPLKKASSTQQRPPNPSPSGSRFEDMDDDIPF